MEQKSNIGIGLAQMNDLMIAWFTYTEKRSCCLLSIFICNATPKHETWKDSQTSLVHRFGTGQDIFLCATGGTYVYEIGILGKCLKSNAHLPDFFPILVPTPSV